MSTPTKTDTRRRGAALETALIDAAWDELNEVGYEQFSLERVALRAGTSKTVLYRRWANRVELVHAVLKARSPLVSNFTPNTGSLRGDVYAVLEHMSAGIDTIRMSLWAGMLSDATNDNQLQQYISQQLIKDNVIIMRKLVEQARSRHEAIVSSIPDRVLILPMTLVRHELILTGRVLTWEAMTEIVDDIFMPLVRKK